MKRTQAQNEYKWDFSHLYENTEQWKKDLEEFENIITKISDLKGKLGEEKNFQNYLDLDVEADFKMAKLNQYIHLYDINQTDSELQELDSLFTNVLQETGVKTSFVIPEVLKIGKEKIFSFINNKDYEQFKYRFESIFEKEKHILENHKEELLSKVDRSRVATAMLYDSLSYADKLESTVMVDGKEEVVDTTFFKNTLEDSRPLEDQNFRKEVWDKYFNNVTQRKYSFAKIYESIILKQVEDKKVRNYDSVLEQALFNDGVSVDIYKKLLEVGKKHIQPLKDYYLLIKKKNKLDNFYTTDRELKLVSEYNEKFDVETGIDTVKTALSELGPEYFKKLHIAFSDNRIDYFEDTNKVSGAYSSGGTGVEPIILMNWDDKLSSLSTLAHEVGHSVHTLFSEEEQKYPLSDYPIILAEVASTFNEHVLFDFLYSTTNDKNKKIYLLQQRIFDLISTFYRQIQFADFEYRAHKLVEDKEPLTSEILMELFREVENEYGYDVFDDKDREVYHWPYISHFFHSPFYVYKYAVDLVASFKLFDDFKSGDNLAIINFLKKGGSKKPLEILKECGVDFEKEDTYMPLINEIKRLNSELESLL
ncbi:oligoendopeptidase F [Spiroplasma chinense]|uniref:Oligopeptidase F n=1 Tax=Spiroplasma chinense TaxID=216932 RepID=A0A5B9Y5H5_9MOLU|nr:oligoendopeptidase F [Spiroplasma chinense]QEH62344.1 oligoendopeptidase F [Spiroplasma chinense]